MTDKDLPALPELVLDLRRVISPVLTNAIEAAVRDYALAAVAQRDEQIRWWRERWHEMERQRDELRAEVEALRESLRNIAETCEWNAEAPGSDEEKARWARVAAFARASIDAARAEVEVKNKV